MRPSPIPWDPQRGLPIAARLLGSTAALVGFAYSQSWQQRQEMVLGVAQGVVPLGGCVGRQEEDLQQDLQAKAAVVTLMTVLVAAVLVAAVGMVA